MSLKSLRQDAEAQEAHDRASYKALLKEMHRMERELFRLYPLADFADLLATSLQRFVEGHPGKCYGCGHPPHTGDCGTKNCECIDRIPDPHRHHCSCTVCVDNRMLLQRYRSHVAGK